MLRDNERMSEDRADASSTLEGPSLTRGPVAPLVERRGPPHGPFGHKLPLSPWLGQLWSG